MRLSNKFSFATATAVTLATSISAVMEVQREIDGYERDLVLDADRQARALAVTVAKLWTTFGDAGAIDVLDAANSVSLDVRAEWISLRRLLGGDILRLTSGELARLEAGQPFGQLAATQDSKMLAVAYAPVILDGTIYGAVQLLQVGIDRSAFIFYHVWRATLTALGIILVSWFLAVVLGRRWIGRPIEELVHKAQQVGKGNLEERVHLETHDELATLADALNTMSNDLRTARDELREETQARLDAMEQVQHADRLATIGQLAAGIAHELGTPLNIVSERAKMVRAGEVTPAEVHHSCDVIVEQIDRIAKTIRQLLDFSRQQPATKAMTDLRLLANSTRDLLSSLLAKRAVTIRVEGAESAPAYVDAGKIRQALLNLVMNAIQAMAQPGEVTLSIAQLEHMPNRAPEAPRGPKAWAIAISDRGKGIDKNDLPHIFKPFFTTKSAGEGTGLGLANVKSIVEEHGGSVEVVSGVDRGSTFTVYLPAEE